MSPAFGLIVGWCVRNRLLTVAASLVITVLAGFGAATGLKINTDTGSLIDPELAYRQAYVDFIREFPNFDQNLILFANAQNEIYEREAIELLAAKMSSRSDLFTSVRTVFDDTASSSSSTDVSAPPRQWRHIVIAKPVLDFTNVDPSEIPIRFVRDASSAIETAFHAEQGSSLSFSLTGEAALNSEEMESATSGAAVAGIVSLVLVALTLGFGLRSAVHVATCVGTLLIGIVWTAGLAALTVGSLNLISVAFAVLFIGLGVDFLIHFILWFEEERRSGHEPNIALYRAADGTGPAFIACAITTAAAFLSFAPTPFVGLAQLGIISAGGMAVALLLALTLLPVLLSLFAGATARKSNSLHSLLPSPLRPAQQQFTAWRNHQPWQVVRSYLAMGLVLVSFIGLVLSPQLEFDSDPLSLKDQRSPSVVAFRDLLENDNLSPYRIMALIEPAQIVAAHDALEALDVVGDTYSLLTEMRDYGEEGRALDQLNAAVEYVPLEDRPDFLASDGRWLVSIGTTGDVQNPLELAEFVAQVRAVLPQATGMPVEIVEAGHTIRSSLRQATLVATFIVLLVLVMTFRNLQGVVVGMLPLLVATGLTFAAMLAMGLKFNFANVIVVPLMLGLGVDSSLHALMRWRQNGHGFLRTSTSRSIVISTLTTICSFGALMISQHDGTATMGELLLVSISAVLVSTMVVLPAAIDWLSRHTRQHAASGRDI